MIWQPPKKKSSEYNPVATPPMTPPPSYQLGKHAAGGSGQAAMDTINPLWLTRLATFPISGLQAAVQKSPSKPHVLIDALEHAVAIQPDYKHYSNIILPRETYGWRGSQELFTALYLTMKKNPTAFKRMQKLITDAEIEGQSGRRFIRGLGDMVSGAIYLSRISNAGELGVPRNVLKGLKYDSPHKKVNFIKRMLFPNRAGAEMLGRSIAARDPNLAKMMIKTLDTYQDASVAEANIDAVDSLYEHIKTHKKKL